MTAPLRIERRGRIILVTIDRPERRNAVDLAAAEALLAAFKAFAVDSDSDVAVLNGAGGNFCAGADLHAIHEGEPRPLDPVGEFAPMGPTRLRLPKPVIAAIEGYAVAGGLELALWCDLRIAGRTAVMGVFNRRLGVPLVDLGTIRLPRLIGHSRAADLILTGRPVEAEEALEIGLVNRVVDEGAALGAALTLAEQLASFPQAALRNDRFSLLEQWDLDEVAAVRNEVERGAATLASGETAAGAALFAQGSGRHGVKIAEPSGKPRQVG
jgi:enoyl-CoA hydratase